MMQKRGRKLEKLNLIGMGPSKDMESNKGYDGRKGEVGVGSHAEEAGLT